MRRRNQKGRAKRHAEFDGPQVSALVVDRNHAARAQIADSDLQAVLRLALGIGRHHRMTKPGEIISIFIRQMQAQK